MFDNSLRRQEIEDEEIRKCLTKLMLMMMKIEVYPIDDKVQMTLSEYRDKYCETIKTPRISGTGTKRRKGNSRASQLAFQNANDRHFSDDSKTYSKISVEASEE